MIQDLVLPCFVLVAVADEDLGNRLRHGTWTSFGVVQAMKGFYPAAWLAGEMESPGALTGHPILEGAHRPLDGDRCGLGRSLPFLEGDDRPPKVERPDPEGDDRPSEVRSPIPEGSDRPPGAKGPRLEGGDRPPEMDEPGLECDEGFRGGTACDHDSTASDRHGMTHGCDCTAYDHDRTACDSDCTSRDRHGITRDPDRTSHDRHCTSHHCHCTSHDSDGTAYDREGPSYDGQGIIEVCDGRDVDSARLRTG